MTVFVMFIQRFFAAFKLLQFIEGHVVIEVPIIIDEFTGMFGAGSDVVYKGGLRAASLLQVVLKVINS